MTNKKTIFIIAIVYIFLLTGFLVWRDRQLFQDARSSALVRVRSQVESFGLALRQQFRVIQNDAEQTIAKGVSASTQFLFAAEIERSSTGLKLKKPVLPEGSIFSKYTTQSLEAALSSLKPAQAQQDIIQVLQVQRKEEFLVLSWFKNNTTYLVFLPAEFLRSFLDLYRAPGLTWSIANSRGQILTHTDSSYTQLTLSSQSEEYKIIQQNSLSGESEIDKNHYLNFEKLNTHDLILFARLEVQHTTILNPEFTQLLTIGLGLGFVLIAGLGLWSQRISQRAFLQQQNIQKRFQANTFPPGLSQATALKSADIGMVKSAEKQNVPATSSENNFAASTFEIHQPSAQSLSQEAPINESAVKKSIEILMAPILKELEIRFPQKGIKLVRSIRETTPVLIKPKTFDRDLRAALIRAENLLTEKKEIRLVLSENIEDVILEINQIQMRFEKEKKKVVIGGRPLILKTEEKVKVPAAVPQPMTLPELNLEKLTPTQVNLDELFAMAEEPVENKNLEFSSEIKTEEAGLDQLDLSMSEKSLSAVIEPPSTSQIKSDFKKLFDEERTELIEEAPHADLEKTVVTEVTQQEKVNFVNPPQFQVIEKKSILDQYSVKIRRPGVRT